MKNVTKIVISGTVLVAAGVVTKLYKNEKHSKKALELAKSGIDTYAETASVNLYSFYDHVLEQEVSENDARDIMLDKLISNLSSASKKMTMLDEEKEKDVAILEIYKELFASVVTVETFLEYFDDNSDEIKRSIKCAEKLSKEISDAIAELAWLLTK